MKNLSNRQQQNQTKKSNYKDLQIVSIPSVKIKKEMATFSLVFIVAAYSITQVVRATTPFEQCTQGPPPLALRVTGCNENPCKFSSGDIITVTIDFQATTATDTIGLRVIGTANATVLETVDIDNACSLLTQGSCPLALGDTATLEYEHVITNNFYSDVVVSGEYIIFNDKERREICFEYTGLVSARNA